MSKMADESETFRASYSAAGGTLGTLCGAVTALIIMIIILELCRLNLLLKKMRRNPKRANFGMTFTKMNTTL